MLPLRRAVVFDRTGAWRLSLGALFVLSAGIHTWVAWLRATPNYFPDELIYSSLARSLAAGHLPAVRGHVVFFPALLEPLVTAPAWWFGSIETSYRITQAIGAVAMSTAAVAAFWSARRLGASERAAFGAACLAVAVPELAYSGWILSEPFAYPLFIAAVGAAATALARPARSSQLLFAALALLATLARVQLALLFAAYVLASLLLRRAHQQRWVIGVVGGLVAAAAVVGLGFYNTAHFHLADARALGQNALVLAFAAGWVVVPAALAGVVAAAARPRTPDERAFGVFAILVGGAVLVESWSYGGGPSVHERYGFYVAPLLALGLAIRGRAWPRLQAALAATLFTVSALVPMSGWAAAGGNAHSLVLTALLEVERLAGSAGAGSLIVAAVAGALALVALGCALRAAVVPVVVLGIAFSVAASAFATSFDVRNSRNVRTAFLPAGPEWVTGHATVVGSSSRTSTLEQFFWNRHLGRLALLPGEAAPDVFATATTHVTRDGRFTGVRGPVVVQEDGVAYLPRRPGRWNGMWLSAASPRLSAELEGWYRDGWIAPSGRGRVFGGGAVELTVDAPEATTLTVAGRALHLRPGRPALVCAKGAFTYRFSTHGFAGVRVVSARATFPRAVARCG